MSELTDQEIKDLRELLDQIEKVALDEDTIATLIEYKGEEVVITEPVYIDNVIEEALEEASVEVDSNEE